MTRALVLIPTQLEWRILEKLHDLRDCPAELCGFGPIASAARAAQLIAEHRPAHVYLCGVAGTYREALAPVGTARMFRRIAMDGVGAGIGEDLRGPEEMDFPQWSGEDPIYERISFAEPGPLLLTVAAASATDADAAWRRERFPDALGEDMEGFGVAMACRLYRVELTVVRGFSNRAGDRVKARWMIQEALAAAQECLLEELQ